MTCEQCNAPTQIVEQSGGTKEGNFKEEYECVNGHKGWIRGDASAPPQEWRRTGSVFEG